MTTRVVSKSLICEEDLQLGVGTVSQSRGGNDYTLNKLTLIKAVTAFSQLASVDTTKYRYAIIFGATASQVYWYDDTYGWLTYSTDTVTAASIEEVRLSTYSPDYIDVVAYTEGGSVGSMRLYQSGTGIPTASAAAIPAALAAGTFCNAAGICFKLRLDQPINHFMFGFTGAANETTSILAATSFAATNKCILYWLNATYNTASLAVPSNSHWVFQQNVILQAIAGYGATDCLLNFNGTAMAVLDCSYAVFKMIKAEYVSGEARHLFNLVNCTDVTLIHPDGRDSGGDIYYINGATRLTMHSPRGQNARRNTCSVIKATDLDCTGIAKFQTSSGTAPEGGLVFEPNSATDTFVNVRFDIVEISSCNGSGCVVYLDDHSTSSTSTTEISINKLFTKSNVGMGLSIANVFSFQKGLISIGEFSSRNDGKTGLRVYDKNVDGPVLRIGKVTIDNCSSVSASSVADRSGVYIVDTSATDTGSIYIDSISVRGSAETYYGVYAELGQGISRSRINIDYSYSTYVSFQPLRYGNSSAAVAEASKTFVTTYLKSLNSSYGAGTFDLLTSTIGFTHIVTDATTLRLREYPPIGTAYGVKVEAGTATIDTYDALDKIVGTTVAGATVTSNVIGAECTVHFLGTVGGVRYWKLIPIGRSTDWTFN